MAKVIGVQFQKNGKMYYFDAGGFAPVPGEFVIVDTVRGADLAEVIMGVREVEDTEGSENLKRMLRIATPQDMQHSADNRVREREAYGICQKKIAEHQLEMKLVSVEYAFDNSRILFYFTANGRVDFRSLVKDLASVFKTRIELRQIGVRDEARMLGSLGPCGRPICCGTFLTDFQPVSIKMAKEQNLSLNPTKISGVCGRLMCCLKYEQDLYEQTRKKMPRVGREVETPDGRGTVTDLNIVKETVSVRITSGDSSEIKEYELDQIRRPDGSGSPYRPRSEEPAQEEDGSEELQDETTDADAAVAEAEPEGETAPDDAGEAPEEEFPRRERFGRRPERGAPRGGRRERPERGFRAERSERSEKNWERREKPEETERTERPEKAWDSRDKSDRAEGLEKTGESPVTRGHRNSQLGRPVRRENPNRGGHAQPQAARSVQDSRIEPASQAEEVSRADQPDFGAADQTHPAKKAARNSWSDQLAKAMSAIEEHPEA